MTLEKKKGGGWNRFTNKSTKQNGAFALVARHTPSREVNYDYT